MTAPPRRWYAHLSVSDARGNSLCLRGAMEHPHEPTARQIFEALRDLAPYSPPLPVDLHVAHLFELPNVPRPVPDDGRPLRHWRVEVDFACDEVRMTATATGVFGWPEPPPADALGGMKRLLIAEHFARSGEAPELIDYAEERASSVRETNDPLTHSSG